MSVTATLAAFALWHTFRRPTEQDGEFATADAMPDALPGHLDRIVGWLKDRYTDHSQTLPKALSRANDRAWQAVGLALAGEGLFDRVQDWFRSGDLTGLRDQIREFLAATPTGLEGSADQFRVRACAELNQLRQSGRLTRPHDRAAIAADLRRYGDAVKLVTGAEHAVAAVAAALAADAPYLARVLRLAPPGGTPLLASGFVFFFRREVETNGELAHGLTFDSLRHLTATQDRGFALLDGRTAGILDQFDVLFDALGNWFATIGSKLDDQAAQLREIQERLAQPKRPGVSYDTDDERDFLRRAKDEFRRNPGRVGAAAWGQLGDAMSAAKMYPDAGDAHHVAASAAEADRDTATAAANHYKAYRDACDAGSWERAAGDLWKAVELDEIRYRPFNRRRFTPIRILGGGAFGTVFLCHDQNNPDPDTGELLPVAIKTLRAEALSRDLTKVLAEAITLKGLKHPNIIGILDQDFADDARTRPFLVLEYFPGTTLETWARDHGPLPVADVLVIARQVAAAVHAAHTRPKPVFHRDLKPANIMVQRHPDDTWAVKVIDFGLAVRATAVRASLNVPQALRSTEDKSVAGTIKYAPPEQLGELPGVEIGPYSDVYAFGKTFLELLFGHTQPQDEEWEDVPEPVRSPVKKVFTQCVRHALTGKFPRYASLAPVLEALAALDPAAGTPYPPSPLATPQPAAGTPYPPSPLTTPQPAAGPASGLPAPPSSPRPKQTDPLDPARSRQAGETIDFSLGKIKTGGLLGFGAKEIEVQMTFAWCPPGTFLMGSNHKGERGDERGRQDDDKSIHRVALAPVHRVTLTKGFYVGIHPVTHAQWKVITGASRVHFKGDSRPVENVAWDDCQEFCRELSSHLNVGVICRLPTEAEWEYACRAGTTTEYHFGDVINADHANYDGSFTWNGSPKGTSREMTTDVGSFPANPWGLYDVHGNVWEWCQDWYGPYSKDDQIDPIRLKRHANEYRVLRGGAWNNRPDHCRSAYRDWVDPVDRDTCDFGCRVCFHLE